MTRQALGQDNNLARQRHEEDTDTETEKMQLGSTVGQCRETSSFRKDEQAEDLDLPPEMAVKMISSETSTNCNRRWSSATRQREILGEKARAIRKRKQKYLTPFPCPHAHTKNESDVCTVHNGRRQLANPRQSCKTAIKRLKQRLAARKEAGREGKTVDSEPHDQASRTGLGEGSLSKSGSDSKDDLAQDKSPHPAVESASQIMQLTGNLTWTQNPFCSAGTSVIIVDDFEGYKFATTQREALTKVPAAVDNPHKPAIDNPLSMVATKSEEGAGEVRIGARHTLSSAQPRLSSAMEHKQTVGIGRDRDDDWTIERDLSVEAQIVSAKSILAQLSV